MHIGKLLIGIGIALTLVGVVLSYYPGVFAWFGKLPGDIRIEDAERTVFIPITSMIIVSVIISLLLNLYLRR